MRGELDSALSIIKCRHTMVSHGVQGRATASTVAFLRWLVLWPISSVAWVTEGV